jgi:hypothetical protein
MSEGITAEWIGMSAVVVFEAYILYYIIYHGENSMQEKTVRSIKSILWIVCDDSPSARTSSHAGSDACGKLQTREDIGTRQIPAASSS